MLNSRDVCRQAGSSEDRPQDTRGRVGDHLRRKLSREDIPDWMDFMLLDHRDIGLKGNALF